MCKYCLRQLNSQSSSRSRTRRKYPTTSCIIIANNFFTIPWSNAGKSLSSERKEDRSVLSNSQKNGQYSTIDLEKPSLASRG